MYSRTRSSHGDSLLPQGLDQIIHLAPKGGPVFGRKKRIVVTLAELERGHPGRDQFAARSSGRGIGILPRQPVQRDQSPIIVETFTQPLELDRRDELPVG